MGKILVWVTTFPGNFHFLDCTLYSSVFEEINIEINPHFLHTYAHTHTNTHTRTHTCTHTHMYQLKGKKEMKDQVTIFTQTSPSFQTTGYMFSPALLFHVLNMVLFCSFGNLSPLSSWSDYAIVRSLSDVVILHT